MIYKQIEMVNGLFFLQYSDKQTCNLPAVDLVATYVLECSFLARFPINDFGLYSFSAFLADWNFFIYHLV